MINIKELVQAGVHFGHKCSRWHPRMAPYIWGFRNNIHLIDVSKTARQLEKAAQFLESVAAKGETILWVGTKKVAQGPTKQIAEKLGYPYVIHRWIGGTLTNHSQVKKSVTKLLHCEDILKKSEQFPYTKKELGVLQKQCDRLKQNVGTIKNFSWPVGAVVIVDIKKDQTALREAAAMKIPVVALVDTNCDPSLVDYVVPSNDDAPKAITLLLEYLSKAVEKGQEKSAELKAQEKLAQEQKAAAKKEAAAAKKAEKKPVKKEAKAPAKVVKKPVAVTAEDEDDTAPAKKSTSTAVGKKTAPRDTAKKSAAPASIE